MPRLIWRTFAAAAITATALAGCGSASNAGGASSDGATTPTPTGTSTAESPAPGSPQPGSPGNGKGDEGDGSGNGSGAPHCTTRMLDASLTDLDAATGNRYATLVLTNKSGTDCTTGGWSGLALSNADGRIPTRVIREGSAETITVPSGGHAYERLHWAAIPAEDETGTDCEPVAAVLKVIPPNETTQTNATWNYGPVCQHGQIRLTPVAERPEQAQR